MIRARAGLLALSLVTVPSRAAAQADTAQRDTTAAPDTSEVLLSTFEPSIAPGPLPRGARYTFSADSLLFLSSRTLSDLLSHIPGVYVARGGWYGQAEIPLYGGRGPDGLEIFIDGVPFMPLGRDSIYLDPARISLASFQRVDVIILPAFLQVYLVTVDHRSTNPRTQIGVMTGRQDISTYRGGYSRRTRSGFGVSLVADASSIAAGPLSSTTTSFGTSDFLLKAEYLPPGERIGASFQLISSSWHRSAATDDRVDGWRQDRRDRLLRVFLAQRDDGLGWRVTGTLAATTMSHDTVVGNRSVSNAIIDARLAFRHATVAGTARFGAGGAPQQFEARAGWMPLAPITMAAWFRQSLYADGRAGIRAHGTAGLILPFGFSARAEASWRNDVQSALFTTDDLQRALDVAGWVRFEHPRLRVEVGRGRRDPFAPLGFARGIKVVDSLGPTPLTEFVAARASVQIVPGLRLSGSYFNPLIGGGDFEPPHHARISATFHSKFWRVFKSGIFALRAEVAMESWSRWGFAGLDSLGNQRTMNGATFVDTNLQMQLAGVTLFWTIQNINVMRSAYVEGLGFPKAAQSYGARWYFTN